MTPNIKAALFGMAGFFLFAVHDLIIKMLGTTYSPFQIVFFSVLFGFPLVTLLLVRDSSPENLRPHHPWWTLIRTVALMVSIACAFYAFATTPLTEVYAIVFMMPMFATLLSIPMLGERVGLHRGAAMLICLIGVLVVLRPDTTGLSTGHIAALAAAFGSALGSIIVRRIGKEERDVVLLLFPMLGNFLMMGALMPFFYVPVSIQDLGAMALISLLSIMAFSCMIAAYKVGEAAVVAPMQYSQMIWAVLFGLMFFNETPDKLTLIGTAIIIAGGLYIVGREASANVSANQPVLRSRSRLAGGGYLSVGSFMRIHRLWHFRHKD